ncbi:hypothetical protein LSTR_LSTR016649 [Laodelphax striatellus]|uniref:NR LBD domain-containing protein n=1 Tax=Laodelphax striatellus TaxID=195883 RepID=A0A482XEB7_LAOST|nr:hypothetical protein LSTR_LSTR016649 [Laodelphax striatellus]
MFFSNFPDRPALLEAWKVEKIQEIYLEALKSYVDNRIRPKSSPIFAKLLSVLTELRTLGNQNSEMCFFAKVEKQKTARLSNGNLGRVAVRVLEGGVGGPGCGSRVGGGRPAPVEAGGECWQNYVVCWGSTCRCVVKRSRVAKAGEGSGRLLIRIVYGHEGNRGCRRYRVVTRAGEFGATAGPGQWRTSSGGARQHSRT